MSRMTRKELRQHLSRFHACSDAAAWVDATKGQPDVLWVACARGDWMLWLAARAGVDRRSVVLAACACARLALRHVPAGEERPRKAIETAEAWARGEAALTEARKAANAAYAAAYAYADAAYADAAYATDAAVAAADAAAAANANAAYAAAVTAAYAGAAAAREKTLAKCAAIVRERIKWSDIASALAAGGAP